MTSPIRTEYLTKRFRRVNAVNGLDLEVTEGSENHRDQSAYEYLSAYERPG